MIALEHLADDTGALAVLLGRIEAHVAHRIKDAPLHRLEAVADVGQRPRGDDRHRVREIALPHFVFDVYVLNNIVVHELKKAPASGVGSLSSLKGFFFNIFAFYGGSSHTGMPSSSIPSTAKSSNEIAPWGSGEGPGSSANASASLSTAAWVANTGSSSSSGASKLTAGRGCLAGEGVMTGGSSNTGAGSEARRLLTLVPMRPLAALAAAAISAR